MGYISIGSVMVWILISVLPFLAPLTIKDQLSVAMTCIALYAIVKVIMNKPSGNQW